MIYILLISFCVLFIESFIGFRVLKHVYEGSSNMRLCMQTLLDANADDETKEKIARNSSFFIGKHTIIFIVKFALIVSILFAISKLAIAAGWVTYIQLEQAIASWPLWAALTIFSLLYLKIRSYALS